MEPRGEPAVLILPRDVSVNREGERCGPRGGDGLGSSFGSATQTCISADRVLAIARCRFGHHTDRNRCVAFAFGIPRFPGTQSRTLEALFPCSFQPFARWLVVPVLIASVPSWVCFFPPLPWVKGSTANRLGDEECISTSRARSRRTRFSSLLRTTENKTEVLSPLVARSSIRGVSLLRVESELEIPCEQRASKHHLEGLFSFSRT